MDIAQKQQLFFNDARNYAADEAALNVTRPDRVNSNYNVAFTVVNDPNDPFTFTITATPLSGTRQVSDGPLTIDSTGQKLRNGTTAW
jgi:type IV pilus assembly protein PilE